MEFTPQQLELLKRLRKQNRQWPITRWILLALGILSVFASTVVAYAFYLVAFEPPQDSLNSRTVFMILSIWTICCLNLLFGLWCFTTVYVKWHGDSVCMLLLKLLEKGQS